jgi:hypothetical protein
LRVVHALEEFAERTEEVVDLLRLQSHLASCLYDEPAQRLCSRRLDVDTALATPRDAYLIALCSEMCANRFLHFVFGQQSAVGGRCSRRLGDGPPRSIECVDDLAGFTDAATSDGQLSPCLVDSLASDFEARCEIVIIEPGWHYA